MLLAFKPLRKMIPELLKLFFSESSLGEFFLTETFQN